MDRKVCRKTRQLFKTRIKIYCGVYNINFKKTEIQLKVVELKWSHKKYSPKDGRKKRKREQNKDETNREIARQRFNLNPAISVITLNVNGLQASVKRLPDQMFLK